MQSIRRSTRAQRAEAFTEVSRTFEIDSKTWHNYPARIAYVQLPDPASTLGTQEQRRGTTSPSDVKSSATQDVEKMSSEEDRTQSEIPPQASLLGLPAELRNRIYEHIWPEDLIHVSTRPCRADTKGAWEANANKSSWDTKRRFVRWTHTICQVPGEWNRAYTWSKALCSTHDPITHHNQCELAPSERVNRHEACEIIQDSFRVRRYKMTRRNEAQYCPKWSEFQKEYVSLMTERHGPASKGGLDRLHASSKLHLDVLLTCRQIYSEARLLPYARGTWQFDSPTTLATFAERVECSCHIKAHRISDWSWADISSALKALPQVEKVQYSCNYSSGHCGRMALASEMLDTLRYMPREERMAFGLKDVEVILGEDTGKQGRGARREIAAEMERSMMGD